MVKDPGTLTVECDTCGRKKKMQTTEFVDLPVSWGVDYITMQEAGWAYVDAKTYCNKCKMQVHEEVTP